MANALKLIAVLAEEIKDLYRKADIAHESMPCPLCGCPAHGESDGLKVTMIKPISISDIGKKTELSKTLKKKMSEKESSSDDDKNNEDEYGYDE